MKTNRSLKEIIIPKSRLLEDKPLPSPTTRLFYPEPSPLNLDSFIKQQPLDGSAHRKLKSNKTCLSHKQLDIHSIKLNITSPKYFPTQAKTARHRQAEHKLKDFENVHVSPFEMTPHKPQHYKVKVLAPNNSNSQVVLGPVNSNTNSQLVLGSLNSKLNSQFTTTNSKLNNQAGPVNNQTGPVNNQGIMNSQVVFNPANSNVMHIDQPKRPKILSKQRPSHSFFEQFKLGKILGKGRFGNVYRAQHNGTGFLCAVKQISLEKVSRKLIERLTWEMKIQSFIRNEHCLQLYKYYREGTNLYLVIELGEGSLFDRLREKRYFTEVETCYYVTQTIKALRYLHECGVIHRDLKPQNIVLVNNIVKLADFGWAIHTPKTEKRNTFCGTLDYVSPEIVLGKGYDEMVDVWSVGVLCYELATGHAPFESSKSRDQTYKKILNVDLKFPKYLSEDIKDFISRLLTKNPSSRMSLEEAMGHVWVKKYFMK